jgi:putative transposase
VRIPSAVDLHKNWNAWKKSPQGIAWWTANSKCVYQEAFRDLERALRHYWKHRGGAGRAKNPKAGFPKFKTKRRDADHFRLTGAIHVEPKAVVLPRLGRLPTKAPTGKFRGRILSATCRQEADRWYVALCVQVDRSDPAPSAGPVVGIDRGVATLAVCSDGQQITGPNAFQRQLRRTRRMSRAVSRKRKGSKNYIEAVGRLARQQRRIRNQRRDALHKARPCWRKPSRC